MKRFHHVSLLANVLSFVDVVRGRCAGMLHIVVSSNCQWAS